jgi:hypothetical protein
MAKIEGVIKAEIMRLAKREVRAVFRPSSERYGR